MRVLPVLVYTGRSRKGEPESSGSAERGGRCCRCTGSIRCTEGKQYGGNKRGNRAGRSSCLHLPELRRRDCDRCDDGSDILFLLPQPGGAFGRLSGEYMPDFVLPFKISKEQAIEKFLSFTRKKHFIPKDFFEKSQVQKMTGVYFPYWIYGGDFETDYIARGRKVRVWQTGDVEYTETSIYDVRREGEVRVDGLSRNALNKADRDLIECVQPYRLEEMQPFSMGYLSGFQAEKRDIEQQQIAPELKKELETMARGAMRNEANEYISLEQEKMNLSPKQENWRYVLGFPSGR